MAKAAQNSGAHILLVEDTPSQAHLYKTCLTEAGYRVTDVLTAGAAMTFLAQESPDLVLLDLILPDRHGLDVMLELQRRDFTRPIIVITGEGSINIAVQAMQRGARNFLVKPFPAERLLAAVAAALENEQVCTGAAPLPVSPDGAKGPGKKESREERLNFGGFIGTSPAMQHLYGQIESAARSNAPVFITGESGTGKEVCAEAIHKHGPRAGGPFVPINCAAIPRDLMESELFGHVKGAFTGAVMDRSGAASLAEGGTLFLDEIAEMTPDMQTKLLRFLQNFTFTKVGGSKQETTNVRIICATNRDPLAEIQSGRFREDLFYRLHVLPIHMPPLRERGSDVTDIAELFLQRYAAEEDKAFSAFAEDAEAILRAYRWPGNIRQLQNVVRHVAVMNHGDQREVTAAMLPGELMHRRNEGGPTGETGGAIMPLSDVERGAIERAIAACAGNVPQAAAMLGVSPSTIYRKKMAWEEMASFAG